MQMLDWANLAPNATATTKVLVQKDGTAPTLEALTSLNLIDLAAMTDGQLIIGKTGLDPVLAALTGTADQLIVTNGAGSITLSLPQSINTTSSPSFVNVTGTTSLTSPLLKQTGANGQIANYKSVTALVSGLSGASGTATNLIPAGALVLGVTVRVTTLITSGDGSTSFTIGDGTDADAWGTGIVFTLGTTTTGSDFTISTAPFYPTATSVVLTATGGTFSAGAARITAHIVTFTGATS